MEELPINLTVGT